MPRLYRKILYILNFKMKVLYKIITLFAILFITGIFVTAITINYSLNTFDIRIKTIEVKKDTLYLLKQEKKTV